MDGGYFILLGIAIVFLPGILWAFIDSKFSPIPGPTFSFFVAKAFVFGIVAYFLMFMLTFVIILSSAFIAFLGGYYLLPPLVNFILDLGQTGTFGLSVTAIVLTFYITPIFAKFWFIYKDREGLLNFFVGAGGFKSSGGNDVWTTILRPETPYYRVKVIDFQNKRVYVGNVDKHSVSEKTRELFMRFVYIYNFTKNPDDNKDLNIYRDYVYVELQEGNMCIEFVRNQNQAKGI